MASTKDINKMITPNWVFGPIQ